MQRKKKLKIVAPQRGLAIYNRINRGILVFKLFLVSGVLLNLALPFCLNGYTILRGFQVPMQYVVVLLYILAYTKGVGILKQNVPIIEFFLFRVIEGCWYIFVSRKDLVVMTFVILCLVDVLLLAFGTFDKIRYEYVREAD